MNAVVDPPDRVGVVGCGLMGSGIAEVWARAGVAVEVYERDAAAARAGCLQIEESLERAAARSKVSEAERDQAWTRISVHADLDRFAACDLVIDAVSEDLDVKVDLFRRLDLIVGEAILASNTSSIPIMRIAMATRRPESVIGMHFFNPVPVMRLVEIVPSMLTSQDTLDRAAWLVSNLLDRQPITSQDRAGFIVNSLLVPYLLAGIRLYDSGFASAEDIDTGMVLGCGHPMGPLRLADLIGLDTLQAIAESMYTEFKEPLYSPAPFLLRMVEAGRLGKKSGRGFYSYER